MPAQPLSIDHKGQSFTGPLSLFLNPVPLWRGWGCVPSEIRKDIYGWASPGLLGGAEGAGSGLLTVSPSLWEDQGGQPQECFVN